MKDNSVHVIGSGFSALAASCYLAKSGYQVKVFEKNDSVGGRARQNKIENFTFDIGPTWYWMPDVFERFFSDFNRKPEDFYSLEKLSPAYQVYFDREESIVIPDNLEEIYQVFEENEVGSSIHLKRFIKSAKKNYDIAIKDLVYKPGKSPLELIRVNTALRLGQFWSNIRREVRKKIRNPKLLQILEFPVLFLGAKPSNTPAFYNFMNFADFGLGTWHPKGGMHQVVQGIYTLARELGVEFQFNSTVEKIEVNSKKEVSSIQVNGKKIPTQILLSGADYYHTETLLEKKHKQYSEKYWDSRVFAPSALLFFIGFSEKLKNVSHHTLFFDTDFDVHAKSIYDKPEWPEKPLFYASFPSITDDSFAPENQEAATFLIPLAPGIEDTDALRAKYQEMILSRLEKMTNQTVKEKMLFSQSFCLQDFKDDYNSYKGNAYGLANTLFQTAFLRPKIQSSKLRNLFFTGQLTVPGPGVPPSLISGKIAASLIQKTYGK